MIADQQINQWDQIVAKAWQDDAFKKRLLASPAAVLKEQGLEAPPGVQIRVVENSDKVVHLTIPAETRDGELSDAELAGVAGGGTFNWFARTFGQSVLNLSPKEAEQTRGSYTPREQARWGDATGTPSDKQNPV